MATEVLSAVSTSANEVNGGISVAEMQSFLGRYQQINIHSPAELKSDCVKVACCETSPRRVSAVNMSSDGVVSINCGISVKVVNNCQPSARKGPTRLKCGRLRRQCSVYESSTTTG